MIEEIKSIIGPRISAININGETSEFINNPVKQMKFCEAVKHSFSIPLRLTNENMGCPGARRSAGFDTDDDSLTETISGNTRIPAPFVRTLLGQIPTVKDIRHINLGLTNYMQEEIQPDLYIAYVRPETITKLLHLLSRVEVSPSIAPFSLLSVCGNVFSRSYSKHEITVSFGCPESRLHGGIEKHEVVLGIPATMAEKITELMVHN